DDHEWVAELERSAKHVSFKTTNCEYECSAIVEKMRPDIAVIDWSFPKAEEFCDYLTHDLRIPNVKIVAVSDSELPFDYSNTKIAGHISKPLTMEYIENFVRGV
ncbi:MAG: hypothetical protein JSW50_06035, partial [Candidatus Latescibacterota bacterium]